MGIPARLLNQTMTIKRLGPATTYVQDAYGEQIKSWEDVEDVPVMIQALNADERTMLGSEGVDIAFVAFCNMLTSGEVPAEKDRGEVGTDIYEFTHVDDVANLHHHYEIEMVRIVDGGY